MPLRRTPLLLASALLLLAACGPTGSTTGSLQVDIQGLPDGVNPRVEITGGSLTETRVLEARGVNPAISDLAPGTYTITPREVGSSIRYNASPQTADVVAGETKSVTVTYTAPTTGTVVVQVSGLTGGATASLSLTPVAPTTGSTITRSAVPNGTTTIGSVPLGSYTLAATASGFNATLGGATPVNPVVVTAGGTANRTATFSALSMTVTLTGLPASFAIPAPGITVTATQGSNIPSVSFTGTERSKPLALPAAGNYSISATGSIANIAGTYVDTGTLTPVAPAGAVAPGGTATVTFQTRSGSGIFSTGRMFVAGNGSFSNGGRTPPTQQEGGFSVADANIANNAPATAFDSLTGGSNLSATGLFRIAFDRSGNLYALYQGSSPDARVLRVTATNLASGNLSPTATGNTVIQTAVFGTTPEPADMAFDAAGNLWVPSDAGNSLICVSATAMNAGGTIDDTNTTRFARYTTSVSVRPQGDAGLNNLMANIHALAFDRSGNLWFTAGDFRPDRDTTAGGVASVAFGRRSILARITLPATPCSGGARTLSATDIPVRLDISNEARRYVDTAPTPAVQTVNPPTPFGTPLFKPVAMVLAPDGSSLWIGDFGGGNGAVAPNFLDANAERESVIQVALSSGNTAANTPNTTPGDGFNLRPAVFSDRITVAETSTPAAGVAGDRGMQQVFGLAFDRGGRLWVATNNNVEVPATAGSITAPAYAAAGPTERRGKLYGITLDLPSGGFINTPRTIPAGVTLTAPTDGVGFVSIAFNLPNATTPCFTTNATCP